MFDSLSHLFNGRAIYQLIIWLTIAKQVSVWSYSNSITYNNIYTSTLVAATAGDCSIGLSGIHVTYCYVIVTYVIRKQKWNWDGSTTNTCARMIYKWIGNVKKILISIVIWCVSQNQTYFVYCDWVSNIILNCSNWLNL